MFIHVEQFVDHLLVQIGRAQARDVVLMNLEMVMRELLSHPWSWNFRRDQFTLPDPIEETTTFEWTEGDDFIQGTAALVDLTNTHVGRVVYIGTSWYRVIKLERDVGPKIWLDRVLLTSSEEPTVLTFIRRDKVIHSSQIISVGYNYVPSLKRWNPEPYERGQVSYGTQDQAPAGEPVYYNDRLQFAIQSPKKPPVKDGVHSGGLAAGTYYFFYTRYDAESGLESAPGPLYKHVQTDGSAGQAPVIKYGGALDLAEEDVSYKLRLYMSDRSPARLPCKMFRIQERGNEIPSTPAHPVGGTTLNYDLPFYWSGKQTVLTLFPTPQAGIRQYHVSYYPSFGTVFRGDEVIELGDDTALYELIVQYMVGKLGVSARNPEEERKANIHFRGQLQYLLAKDMEAGEKGDTKENHPVYYPGKGLGTDTIREIFGELIWEEEL